MATSRRKEKPRSSVFWRNHSDTRSISFCCLSRIQPRTAAHRPRRRAWRCAVLMWWHCNSTRKHAALDPVIDLAGSLPVLCRRCNTLLSRRSVMKPIDSEFGMMLAPTAICHAAKNSTCRSWNDYRLVEHLFALSKRPMRTDNNAPCSRRRHRQRHATDASIGCRLLVAILGRPEANYVKTRVETRSRHALQLHS